MGLAQQMGHKESSDGNVISESSDCFTFSISISLRTSSISSGETCVGTTGENQKQILKLKIERSEEGPFYPFFA